MEDLRLAVTQHNSFKASRHSGRLCQGDGDDANPAGVLDQSGSVRSDAMEVLGKENGVRISRTAWLSKKDNAKKYGSMVV